MPPPPAPSRLLRPLARHAPWSYGSFFAVSPLLEIRALDIDEIDGLTVKAPLPARWIDAALADAQLTVGAGDWEARSRTEGGRVTARLTRTGRDVVVRGEVEAEVTLACCRCLEPAVIAVRGELALLLQPASRSDLRQPGRSRASSPQAVAQSAPASSDEEYEFSAEEAGLDVYDGEMVVLDDFIREAILLELPQFPLCSEACVGIPPGPSSATASSASPVEPVDPRLAPLGALRNKLAGAPNPSEPADPPTTSTAQRSKTKLRASARRALRKTKRKRRR